MANILKCDIVTPDKMLFRGEGTLISAPAAGGDIGFMYLCAPLMSTLQKGAVRIKSDNDETTVFIVNGGYVETDGHKVVVLASRAIDAAEIDIAVSNERIDANKKRIQSLQEGDPAIKFCEAEIAWQEQLIAAKSN